MAKKAYIGVENIARNVKNIYIGVNDVARKIVKGYIGDENGIARQWWPSIIWKHIFRRVYDFNSEDFTIYSATKKVNQMDWVEYTKYGAVSDRGDLVAQNMFSCFNVVETGTGTVGPSNPVHYTFDYEGTITAWKLEIPQGEASAWWMCIPIFAFGVVAIEADVTGYSASEVCEVGIATRVSDDTKQAPNYYSQNALIEGQTVIFDFSTNPQRADYLYIAASNNDALGTKLWINEIKIACERTYGKVDVIRPLPYIPLINVNFPRFGYRIGSDYAELLVTNASSAVYMVIFNSDNSYINDHEYTDIDNGDSWGTGLTYVLFISKNTFSLNWCQGINIAQALTLQSITIWEFGEPYTSYFYLYTVPSGALQYASPMYNHAYTQYRDDWINTSGRDTIIGTIGRDILYLFPIQ